MKHVPKQAARWAQQQQTDHPAEVRLIKQAQASPLPPISHERPREISFAKCSRQELGFIRTVFSRIRVYEDIQTVAEAIEAEFIKRKIEREEAEAAQLARHQAKKLTQKAGAHYFVRDVFKDPESMISRLKRLQAKEKHGSG